MGKPQSDLPWQNKGNALDGQDALRGQTQQKKEQDARNQQKSTLRVVLVFTAGAIVTLGCGVVLENSGGAIVKHIGMTGVLFGATVLAASTSLPELSTGLASIKLGDYQLAVSDIFGGNIGRIGMDSLAVLLLYVLGLGGLVFIVRLTSPCHKT